MAGARHKSGPPEPVYVKNKSDDPVVTSAAITSAGRIPQVTVFDELMVAELTPVVQLQFPYNVNSELVVELTNNGTPASVVDSLLKVGTGAGTNRSSAVTSHEIVQYNPGQGVLARFTALFSNPAEGSTQIAGIGNASDGFFFGYDDTIFGVLHRSGGAREFRTLTITTKSTTAENITITLDSVADSAVAVTDATAGDITTTANDIADHDYSHVGTGWQAYAIGATVVFISFSAAPYSGTYSLSSATTAVGTFASTIAGVSPTDTWVSQSNWNIDDMLGDGPSGMTLDRPTGNVYAIAYQFLGFGPIFFYVEKDNVVAYPYSNRWQLVHVIQYNNNNSLPSVRNPTLPLCVMVGNTTNATDIEVSTSSMAGFVEGKVHPGVVSHSADGEQSGIGTTITPVLSILNGLAHAGVENRVRVRIDSIIVSSSAGNKVLILEIVRDSVLTGASYTIVHVDDSVMLWDDSATAVVGGEGLFTTPLSVVDREIFKFTDSDKELILHPGEHLSVSARQTSGGTSATVNVSINWTELF